MATKSAFFSTSIYFSYLQFYVYDRSVTLPGCAWTDVHFAQGFARREKHVCFGTLLEFGHAELAVYLGPYQPDASYQRVIEVPLEVSSGEVGIEGPDEVEKERFLKIEPGHYRLVAAQQVVDEDREKLDVFFEKVAKPLANSRIIVADNAIRPATPLLESAEIAE